MRPLQSILLASAGCNSPSRRVRWPATQRGSPKAAASAETLANAILIAVSRDGDFAIAHDFSKLVPGDRALFIVPLAPFKAGKDTLAAAGEWFLRSGQLPPGARPTTANCVGDFLALLPAAVCSETSPVVERPAAESING
jgi:hypothetical protein